MIVTTYPRSKRATPLSFEKRDRDVAAAVQDACDANRRQFRDVEQDVATNRKAAYSGFQLVPRAPGARMRANELHAASMAANTPPTALGRSDAIYAAIDERSFSAAGESRNALTS